MAAYDSLASFVEEENIRVLLIPQNTMGSLEMIRNYGAWSRRNPGQPPPGYESAAIVGRH